MNYRHIYHAGNFADIFKHLLYFLTLSYLQQKDKGFAVLDAFAGIGIYDLSSDQAHKTGEFRGGVELFCAEPFANPDLEQFRLYLKKYWAFNIYAGSPQIAADLKRPQDRILLNELHKEDAQILRDTFKGMDQIHIHQLDAYQFLKGALPPSEKRGFVLIDPPFERNDEFDLLAQNLMVWHSRFAHGVYAIWYPLKSQSVLTPVLDRAYDLALKDTLQLEIQIAPFDDTPSLKGCGMYFINPPFILLEKIEKFRLEFMDRMKLVAFEMKTG
jgi:23S rRNA (adenine2030-N6)-methyltransferase